MSNYLDVLDLESIHSTQLTDGAAVARECLGRSAGGTNTQKPAFLPWLSSRFPTRQMSIPALAECQHGHRKTV